MRATIYVAVAFVLLSEFACIATSRNILAHEVLRVPPLDSECGCTEEPTEQCGCCFPVKVEILGIDDRACTNITYLPDDVGVQLTFQWNNETFINETLSARNPPPLCSHVPVGLVGFVGVCVKFYNLSWAQEKFGGCMQFELQMIIEYIDFDFGCYYTSRKAHGMISKAAVKELITQALENTAEDKAFLTHEKSSLKKIGKGKDFSESDKLSEQVHPDVDWIEQNKKKDTDKK